MSLVLRRKASEVIEERRAVGTPIEQAYVRYTDTLNGRNGGQTLIKHGDILK